VVAEVSGESDGGDLRSLLRNDLHRRMSFTLITFPSPEPLDFLDLRNFVRSRFDKLLCSVAGGDDGEIRWNDFTAEVKNFWTEVTAASAAALDLLRLLGSVSGGSGPKNEREMEEDESSSRRNSFSIRIGLRSIAHCFESEIEFIVSEGLIQMRGRKFWGERERERRRVERRVVRG